MRLPRYVRRAAPLLLVFLLLRPAWTAADDDATAVTERARAALDRFKEARRSPTARDEVLSEMLAVADPLLAAGRDSLAAACLDCAGILAFQSGRLEDAQSAWTRAVASARSHGNPGLVARCLNSRAVGYAAGGDYERAAAMFLEQIPVRESLGSARSLGTVWANLAGAYKALGRIPESIEASERALRYHREAGDPRGLSGVYGSLADLLVSTDNLPRALAWADSSVNIARRHELPDALGNGLIQRAVVELELGHAADALATLDDALEAFAVNGNPYYASWALVVRGRPLIRLGRGEEYVRSLEKARARGTLVDNPVLMADAKTLEGIALMETGRPAEAESLLAGAERDLEAHRNELQDPQSVAALRQVAAELDAALARCLVRRGRSERAWQVIERGLLSRDEGEVASAIVPADLERLRGLLGGQRAALVYLVDPEEGARLVLRIAGDGLVARESVANAEMRPLLRPVLDLLASGADDEACAPALSRLAATLVPDLLTGVPDGTERLYVVAPPRLSGFPLESLPVPNDDGSGPPLGARLLVTYIPDATALTESETRVPAPEELLAFADPTGSGDEPAETLPRHRRLRATPLPEARAEASDIGARGAHLFVGEDATVAAATGPLARDAAVLHFATHADVNPIRAEQSSLLLSGGLLTATAIRELRLRADLVTLSGCRTGGGCALLGDGTLGLARAFLHAGARSVVASAWDVEDRGARRFMSLFYGALRQGRRRDEALRQARSGMAREGFPPRDRYAFVLVGAGGAPVKSLAATRVDRGALPAVLLLALLAATVTGVVVLARRER